MTPPLLLAVPNVSEGRDARAIAAIGEAFAGAGEGPAGVRLLDVHSDADHHRSVFTLAGRPGELADALLAGAREAVQRVDVMSEAIRHGEEEGTRDPSAGRADDRQHPHVGAVDVLPLVYLDEQARGPACAEALVVADRIGVELDVPVFLYGELTEDGEAPGRTRAQLRRGGVAALARRIASPGASGEGSLQPDFGPARMHASAGATLVAARPPLVAFNLQLAAPATLADARAVAELVREGGAGGLPGVRAIGVQLAAGQAQVSMNIERPLQTPLAEVVHAVRARAPVASAELVGLAPRAALAGFPHDLVLQGFDPSRHVLENALGF